MKKFLLAAILFGLAFTFSACSDDSSSGTEPEKESAETGNFGKFAVIDDDAKKILAEAIKGTDYEDAECDSVSTQVVAGKNYKFQCSVKDGKKTKDVVLTVFEPLPSSDASVQLTLVEDADGKVLFENPVEFKDEGDEGDDVEKTDSKEGMCTGCFGKFSAVDKEAKKILEDAVKGTDYEDAECDSVSTQVVAGTNYKFQCSVKDGKKTKDVVLTVFEPLPSSDASVQLTLVTDSDGEVLFEAEAVEPKDDEKSEKADAKDDEKSKNEKSDEDADSETVEPIAVVDPEEGAVACDGCYGDFKELTAADSAVFEKANKVSDSTFVNPTTVSKQVVAGMNYRFTCELEVSEGETKSVILEVYKNLKDEVEITAVAEIREAPLQEKLDPSAEGVERDCGDSEGDAVTNCAVKIGLEN